MHIGYYLLIGMKKTKENKKNWNRPSIKSTLSISKTLARQNQGVKDGGSGNTSRS